MKMSLFRSLFVGTSGVNAHGSAISVVGDNIANVSTTGFRGARSNFSDVLGGSLGPDRVGAGTRIGGIQTLHKQGGIQQTGAPLDMAVLGTGFFVLRGGTDPTDTYYSRDGRFVLDEEGVVTSPTGLAVQGYEIDARGVQSTQFSDLKLGAVQSPPAATPVAEMVVNLDSDAAVGPVWDPLDPEASSNFSSSITVYDSLGASHRVDLYYRKAAAGQWEWHAMVDGGETTGGTAGTPLEIADGTLTFTTDGSLDTEVVNTSSVDFVNATAGQSIQFDFGDAITTDGGTGFAGTTQYAGPSTVAAVNQDGFGQGILVDISIAENGVIDGVFSNGQSRAMARVALASFNSEDGLTRAGANLFSETTNSGQPLVDAAGEGGRGAIMSGALETSTVDLSTELVTLIAYQRAMQANVRSVTTADEMLAEIANMKR